MKPNLPDLALAADHRDSEPEGTWTSRSHRNALGERRYSLYTPSTKSQRLRAVLMMLHGCNQDADDFAVGTRMSRWADRFGFAVVYPEQAYRANGANCWNWFVPSQQSLSGEEPSLLAEVARSTAQSLEIDPGHVYVAGLSAGASMAVILGRCYPEVFAGVAAHSGLPIGAAYDVQSAFAAMRGEVVPGRAGRVPRTNRPVRTLVLHGDSDDTVAPPNGQSIVRDSTVAFAKAGVPLVRVDVAEGETPAGVRIAEFRDRNAQVMVRHFTVVGGGHAWFGGDPGGSHTADAPIDASAEVVRFFLGPDPSRQRYVR
jgi:poly(hydroxyalkanoate) depolymerase family esterase